MKKVYKEEGTVQPGQLKGVTQGYIKKADTVTILNETYTDALEVKKITYATYDSIDNIPEFNSKLSNPLITNFKDNINKLNNVTTAYSSGIYIEDKGKERIYIYFVAYGDNSNAGFENIKQTLNFTNCERQKCTLEVGNTRKILKHNSDYDLYNTFFYQYTVSTK